MSNFFKNAFAHPKTTIAGILAGVAAYAPVLSQLGLHIGHYGTTDFVKLAGAVAVTVLGATATDAK